MNKNLYEGFVINSSTQENKFILITQHHGRITTYSSFFNKQYPGLKQLFFVSYENNNEYQNSHKSLYHNINLIEPTHIIYPLFKYYNELVSLISILALHATYPEGNTKEIYELLYNFKDHHYINASTKNDIITYILEIFFSFDKHAFYNNTREAILKNEIKTHFKNKRFYGILELCLTSFIRNTFHEQ